MILGAALLAIYASLINSLAYGAFHHDKAQARNGGWRVPESTLLLLAFFGGGLGAKLAQRRFRHKTRKQPFATALNMSAVAGLLLLAAIIVLPAGRGALAAFGTAVAAGSAGIGEWNSTPMPTVSQRGNGSTF